MCRTQHPGLYPDNKYFCDEHPLGGITRLRRLLFQPITRQCGGTRQDSTMGQRDTCSMIQGDTTQELTEDMQTGESVCDT